MSERWQTSGVPHTLSSAIVRSLSSVLVFSIVPSRFAAAVLALVLAGCAAQSPGPRPTRVPSQPAVTDPLAGPWRVRDLGMRRTQRLHVRSVLTSQMDTVVRVDSLESRLEAAWAPVPQTEPARLAGMVESFEVRTSHENAWRTPAGVTLPFSFVAVHEVPEAMPRISTPDAGACGVPNAVAVQPWRELWLELPPVLRAGDVWEDSTTYVLCRDSIPLVVTTVRRFQAVGSHLRGEQQVITVHRTSRTRFDGVGRQYGEEVRLEAEGEAELRLEIALAGGVIVAGEGVAELRMSLTGRRRMQRLVQESQLTIDAP